MPSDVHKSVANRLAKHQIEVAVPIYGTNYVFETIQEPDFSDLCPLEKLKNIRSHSKMLRDRSATARSRAKTTRREAQNMWKNKFDFLRDFQPSEEVF